MWIKFVRCWGAYEPGRVVEFPHPGAAEELIRRKIAVPVKPPKGSTSGTGAVHS